MPRLFGTDGIRGVANRTLTPDLALALGRAAGLVLGRPGGEVVVGRDTRVSGPMLEGALVAGLCSAGVNVHLAGIVPTPAVAFLTLGERAQAGAVISASHNPVPDNGIKFFSDEGTKISGPLEEKIEQLMSEPPRDLPEGTGIGTAEPLDDAQDRYVDHVLSTIHRPLEGMRIVLDCAYGAAYKVGPRAFREAGAADVHALHAEADGTKINVDCGSTSLGRLADAVVAEGADLGLAFDGDADRVLAVDENGKHIDGDQIIAVLALRLAREEQLRNDVVVATVMTNLGFHRALESRGITVIAAPVGDKYVAEEMAARGAVLGGEQSGHVIFGAHSTTGDGVLTGLQLAAAIVESDEPVSRLTHVFDPYPQVLINVPVGSSAGLDADEALWQQVRRHEEALGDEGRVLLRASGTEPLIRVMVEASDRGTADRVAADLAAVVSERFPA